MSKFLLGVAAGVAAAYVVSKKWIKQQWIKCATLPVSSLIKQNKKSKTVWIKQKTRLRIWLNAQPML